MDLQLERFSDINLKDSFFDSLRSSYPEFDEWYHKRKLQVQQPTPIILIEN